MAAAAPFPRELKLNFILCCEFIILFSLSLLRWRSCYVAQAGPAIKDLSKSPHLLRLQSSLTSAHFLCCANHPVATEQMQSWQTLCLGSCTWHQELTGTPECFFIQRGPLGSWRVGSCHIRPMGKTDVLRWFQRKLQST